MSNYEIITIIISVITSLVSSLAVLFTYKNLKAIKEQFFQQNKGNIIFYVDKESMSSLHTFIIKNFGNSPAKLLELRADPKLSWKDTKHTISENLDIDTFKNVFLAPGQFVKTMFDLKGCGVRRFNITIKYETCNRIIEEEYTFDLDYTKKTLSSDPNIKDELAALKHINRSIKELADKFL